MVQRSDQRLGESVHIGGPENAIYSAEVKRVRLVTRNSNIPDARVSENCRIR